MQMVDEHPRLLVKLARVLGITGKMLRCSQLLTSTFRVKQMSSFRLCLTCGVVVGFAKSAHSNTKTQYSIGQ